MTNTMIISPYIFGLAFVIVLGIPTPATARSPMGRHISGIVQMTNIQTREVVMLRTDTGVPLSFVWIGRTIFVVNRQLADAAILKKGAMVEVVYHQPFFGRPFVTKVTLLSASDPHTNMSQKPQMLKGVP